MRNYLGLPPVLGAIRSIKTRAAGLALALVLTAAPHAAQAGFKFVTTPPASQAASSSYLTPPAGSVSAAPVSLMPPVDSATTIASARTGLVEGFADNVPLTVALRQILPRGVMFSIADEVDVQTQVSWRGGRAWQAVLDDTLAAAGLKPVYSQNMVLIARADAGMAMPAAPVTLHAPVEKFVEKPLPSLEPAPAVQRAEMQMDAIDIDGPGAVAPSSTAPLSTTPLGSGQLALGSPDSASLEPVMDSGSTRAKSQLAHGKHASGDHSADQLTAQVNAENNANATPSMVSSMVPMAPPADMDIGGSIAPQNVLIAPDTMAPDSTTAMVTTSETIAETTAATMPADVNASGTWAARSGQTLHEVLSDWAQRAGVELNWISEYDYPIQASVSLNGTFENAVRTILSGFTMASPQPVGRLHRNPQAGEMTLVIEMRGNSSDE